MISADLKVEGLDRLRSRMGPAVKTLDAELRPAMREAALAVRDQARADARGIAVDRRLPVSVQMRSLNGDLTQNIGSVARTAASIHSGRNPGDRVGIGLITGWIKRKGLVSGAAAQAGAVQSIKTRRTLKRGGKTVARAQRDLAWKIALAIRERGTKPLPFIIPAAQKKAQDVGRIINAGVARGLKRIVG